MPFCRECGAKVDEVAKFCSQCGATQPITGSSAESLEIKEEQPQIAPPAQPSYQQYLPPPVQPAPIIVPQSHAQPVVVKSGGAGLAIALIVIVVIIVGLILFMSGAFKGMAGGFICGGGLVLGSSPFVLHAVRKAKRLLESQ